MMRTGGGASYECRAGWGPGASGQAATCAIGTSALQIRVRTQSAWMEMQTAGTLGVLKSE
eukprot:926038-Rhodomonas_salina.2